MLESSSAVLQTAAKPSQLPIPVKKAWYRKTPGLWKVINSDRTYWCHSRHGKLNSDSLPELRSLSVRSECFDRLKKITPTPVSQLNSVSYIVFNYILRRKNSTKVRSVVDLFGESKKTTGICQKAQSLGKLRPEYLSLDPYTHFYKKSEYSADHSWPDTTFNIIYYISYQIINRL